MPRHRASSSRVIACLTLCLLARTLVASARASESWLDDEDASANAEARARELSSTSTVWRALDDDDEIMKWKFDDDFDGEEDGLDEDEDKEWWFERDARDERANELRSESEVSLRRAGDVNDDGREDVSRDVDDESWMKAEGEGEVAHVDDGADDGADEGAAGVVVVEDEDVDEDEDDADVDDDDDDVEHAFDVGRDADVVDDAERDVDAVEAAEGVDGVDGDAALVRNDVAAAAADDDDDESEDERADETNNRRRLLGGFFSRFGAGRDASLQTKDAVATPVAEEFTVEPEFVAQPFVAIPETAVEVVETAVEVVETAVEVVEEKEPEVVRESLPAPAPKLAPEPVNIAPATREEPKTREASVVVDERDDARRKLLEVQRIPEPEPPIVAPETVYVGNYWKRANPYHRGPRVKVVDA